jgi:hypothetical protein
MYLAMLVRRRWRSKETAVNAEPAAAMTTYFRVCDGVRVRYADTRADADTTVLMLAPWPESLWALARRRRCSWRPRHPSG